MDARRSRTVGALPLLALLLGLALASGACTKAHIDIPDRMVELPQPSWSPYDMRAATPEGVILGWRAVRMGRRGALPEAGLTFWHETLRLRLRDLEGYALLEERTVRSANGVEGVEMDMGRDEDGTTWRYRVRIFATPKFLHLVEAGGERSRFEAEEAAIDRAMETYDVRR